MYYYQRLRDLREDKDLNQSEIAKLLNTTQKQYSRWETGEYEMPFHIIIKLARYYNVSIDYIAGLTNDKGGLHNKIIKTANIAARSFDKEPTKTVTGDFSDVLNAPPSKKKY